MRPHYFTENFPNPARFIFLDRTATNVPQVRMVKNRMRDCSMLITLQSLLKLMILLRFKSFHDIPKSGCFSRQGINSISITPIFPLLHVMKGCYHLILLLKDCCNTKSYCPTEISISYPWLIVIHFRSSN